MKLIIIKIIINIGSNLNTTPSSNQEVLPFHSRTKRTQNLYNTHTYTKPIKKSSSISACRNEPRSELNPILITKLCGLLHGLVSIQQDSFVYILHHGFESFTAAWNRTFYFFKCPQDLYHIEYLT